MEPRVQYAKTSDGVDIAFTVYGEPGAPAIVIPPNLMNSHLQLELANSPLGSFLQHLSARLRVVRYDPRGIGMSQRECVDFSVEAMERDLMAVVDRAGIGRFALYNHVLAGEGPMAFAVHHPDRVAGVVFWVGQTLAVSPDRLGQHELVLPIAETNWELFTNIIGRLVWGWDSPNAGPHAEMTRAASSPAAYRASIRAVGQGRNSMWPAQLTVPTLVMHLAGADSPSDIARRWASTIPGAHLVAVPGPPSTLMPFVYDNEILIAAIADFVESLFRADASHVSAPELKLSMMRAILWTDLEGHTSIMQRLGDARGREVLREHERMTRDALSAHGGTEVKSMGDGFMAWFPSAQQALSCAVALQRAFAGRNATSGEPLRVRVGINAGEPVAEEDDLFGNSVIAAARICHEASGGEIVVSDVVRQLVAGKGFAFAERGEVPLKGFDEPLRLFEVAWRTL